MQGLNVSKRMLSRSTGTEGPSSDPYGFTEWTMHLTVDGNDIDVILHCGLRQFLAVESPKGTKVKLDAYESKGRKAFPGYPEEMWKNGERLVLDWFEKLTGLENHKIDKIYNRLSWPDKCPDCKSSKYVNAVSGFPGETLLYCEKCKKIIGSHSNISAII